MRRGRPAREALPAVGYEKVKGAPRHRAKVGELGRHHGGESLLTSGAPGIDRE